MTTPRPLVAVGYPGFVVGLALFTALVAYLGLAEIAAALRVAGSGLLVVAGFHLVPLAADAAGWRRLLADGERPLHTMLWIRWIGESVNGLLPVLQVGGNVVKAQVLTRRGGVAAAPAAASVVVDVTMVVGTQIVFTLLGFALLFIRFGGPPTRPVLIGTATMAALAGAFYLVQRRGLFGALMRALGRIARRADCRGLTAGADAIDADVARLYRNRRALGAAAAWHLASWIIGAGEVWLALAFLGHPVDLATAFVLESLGAAVRAAAFTVPGALGVQEGGYLLLGSAVGLGPETCLALSLSKRVREIVLGVPGLLAWQLEGTLQLVRARG